MSIFANCWRFALLLTVLGWPVCAVCVADEAAPADFSAEQITFYEQQVEPILKQHCLKCHGGEEKVMGGLRLTSRGSLLHGGDSGAAIELDSPEDSILLEAINYDSYEMPPSGKLPEEQLAILTRWVEQGAPWTPGVEDEYHEEEGVDWEQARQYWAYQPPGQPEPPAVENQAWPTNGIDRFILARLEDAGLEPNPAADKVALVRRVYYDLIGLPPTPAQIDAFVNDPSPDAYERLIDELLASPHYGEKWGRHWLDLVRYAETNSFERDGKKPNAWRFRDYVIESFNEDKPYDRFIREQLAGDELADRDAETIIATGYYRLGLWDDEPADREQAYYDGLDDVVSTTSNVFLGMSMGCARCHDHRGDPILQADYYRMVAFFRNVTPYSNNRNTFSENSQRLISTPEELAKIEAELAGERKAVEKSLAELEALVEATFTNPEKEDALAPAVRERLIRDKAKGVLSDEQSERYRQLQHKLRSLTNYEKDFALSVSEFGPDPRKTHLLIRGNAHAEGDEVQPGFPTVLDFDDPQIAKQPNGANTTGRRLALANWIASEKNPLTARVMANRLWQFHFGRGIVPTSNDFGKLGEKPTHPELLDWLAAELVAGDWRIKRMHKLIMMSSAYRMSSRAGEQGLAKDPANDLFWRFDMRRLTGEEVRDSILAVSGELNDKQFGPSVYPKIPKAVLAGQSRPGDGWGGSSREEASRRSIYVHVKRSLVLPILANFDLADTDASCAIRYSTTVPTQSLHMLNGDFINEQAAYFAERLRQEHPDDLAAKVRRAVRLTAGREPSEQEVAADVQFIQQLAADTAVTEDRALFGYCLMMLNTNEFLYLD